jgi:HipA-like protein
MLDIATAVQSMAASYGAYFDPAAAAWFVDGEVPAALQGCVASQESNRMLCLWVNGNFVGTWQMTGKGDLLEYADSWLSNQDACPLSLALPLIPSEPCHSGEVVRNFFENLLPDSSEIRLRLAQRYGARSNKAFDLLEKPAAIARERYRYFQLAMNRLA